MLRRPATAILATAVAGTLLVLAEPTTTASAAARRPDLVISSVSAAAEVRSGSRLRVSVTTANEGRGPAGRSTTKLYLSADRKVGRDAAVGSVAVPRRGGGKQQSATVRLLVPAGVRAGGYRLLACADARQQVREAREGNNCRVARRAVQVTAPDSGSDFPLAPDPITVRPEVDGSRAVGVMVDPNRRTTIEATGADGTTYTLVIPAGALVGPETVTLTPVVKVRDLPLSGGLEAGVQLEPHGLVLLKQAELTIVSPDLGPIAQQTPFYFHESGEDFHLYPVLPPEAGDDADVVRFPIDHFSTPGVGLASPADRAGVQSHPTARDQGQIASAISDLLRAAREADPKGERGIPPATVAQIEALMNSYYDGVIKPQLVAAENSPRDDALVRKAIADALSWVRNLQLFFSDDHDSPRAQDAFERIERVLKAVYLDRWTRCSKDHELEVLPDLLTIARQAALLGYAWADAPYQRFLDCSRFEVRFDSRVTFDGTWPLGGEELFNVPHTGSGRWRAQTTTTNGLGENTGTTQASLPLTQATYHSEYTYQRSDGSTCHGFTDQVGSTPGTLRTTVLPSFNANQREVRPDGQVVRAPVDVLIQVVPTGVIDVRRTVDCGGGDFTDELSSDWLFAFRDFHPADLNLIFGKLADRSADLVYAKTWTNSDSEPNHLGAETYRETTTLEVWHKPAR